MKEIVKQTIQPFAKVTKLSRKQRLVIPPFYIQSPVKESYLLCGVAVKCVCVYAKMKIEKCNASAIITIGNFVAVRHRHGDGAA